MQKLSIMKPVMQTWSPILTSAAVREAERKRRKALWGAFILVLRFVAFLLLLGDSKLLLLLYFYFMCLYCCKLWEGSRSA